MPRRATDRSLDMDRERFGSTGSLGRDFTGAKPASAVAEHQLNARRCQCRRHALRLSIAAAGVASSVAQRVRSDRRPSMSGFKSRGRVHHADSTAECPDCGAPLSNT